MSNPIPEPPKLLDDASVGDAVRNALKGYSKIVPPPGAQALVKASLATQLGLTSSLATSKAVVLAKVFVATLAVGGAVGGTVVGLRGKASAHEPLVPPPSVSVQGVTPLAPPSLEVEQHNRRVDPHAEEARREGLPPTPSQGNTFAPSEPAQSVRPSKRKNLRDSKPGATESPHTSTGMGFVETGGQGLATSDLRLPSASAPPPNRPMPVAENTERPAAQPPSEAQTPAGRLAAEAALLEEAQRALDARRPGAALDLIGRAERAFGESPLTQERNALEVESLWNLGRKAEARARAEQFLQRFPRSPHVVRIRSFSHVD